MCLYHGQKKWSNSTMCSHLTRYLKLSNLDSSQERRKSLFLCINASKEEPLGPDDMWYCPACKKPCQASKKLDLWRLLEILVIHLKRFSYSRFLKNKLEAYVDFPIHDLDLSRYIAQRDGQSPHRYMLYATIMGVWVVATTPRLFIMVVANGTILMTAMFHRSPRTRSRHQLPMFYSIGESKNHNLW